MNISTDLDFIHPERLSADAPVFAGFTCRNGDLNSGENVPGLNLGYNTTDEEETVRRNRRRLLESLGVSGDRIAFADQVHGTRVRVVSEGGTWPETDALVTCTPGLCLGIQVADCAAVLLWDESASCVAAVHAGWRGAAGGIVRLAVSAIEGEGVEPSALSAFISPCISERYFEVGEEVATQFPDEIVNREGDGNPHVNLKAFLRMQLVAAGVPGSRIEVHRGCTYGEEDRYYSYRRQGEESGRMMGLIGIRGK